MRISIYNILKLIVLVSMGQGCFAAAAPYYTWVDEHGVVNYSAEKPRGVDAQLIEKQHEFGIVEQAPTATPSPPAPAVPAAEPAETKDADDAEKQAEFKKTLAEVNAQKKKNCEQSRKNLNSYINRGRIRTKDANGEYRILSDDEKQQDIATFKKAIAENC